MLGWLLAGPLFGISVSMWNEEHSLHHAITLRPREDPQFNYLPLWLISLKELSEKKKWNSATEAAIAKVLVPVQHYTFMPVIIILGRLNFYVLNAAWAMQRMMTTSNKREAVCAMMDVLGMAIYWAWFIWLILRFDSTLSACIFIAVSHWSSGILHVQLLMSHLATNTFHIEEERKEGFFAVQVKTSRNIDTAWYEHWFHGGLEFQIEHHLFPQLPRHNLEAVKPFVMEICAKHGLPYSSVPFAHAVSEVLSDLKNLASADLIG